MKRSLLLLGLCAVWACAPADPAGGGGADAGADAAPAPVADTDNDTITDEQEGRASARDSDGDGTPDYLDEDADDDGVPDLREAGDADPRTLPPDSDLDGTPDYLDTDADGNGIGDATDGTEDLDADQRPDFADLDDDGDGLNDVIEIGPDPAAPVDTDDDGVADHRDDDSDGDTIADRHELMADPDEDQIPAYRDLDSDNDCRPDALEAGDADLETPPVRSDADAQADFLDLDADGDGLLDSLEDKNCNGALDPGESSVADGDTDDDGVTDLVEVAAGTDPQDAADNPQANGDFVFVVPYVMPPSPERDTLDFATDIVKADVVLTMDTTGSMEGEINNLKTSLKSTVIPGLVAEIPSLALGVAEYKDFPSSPYGGSADMPFRLLHRVMTVGSQAGIDAIKAAVDLLKKGGGGDGPESGWEALFQIASGAGVSVGNASVPAFNPAGSSPVAGESIGTLGGVGFRVGSLPVAVIVTDAASHNNGKAAYAYGFTGAATRSSALASLASRGGRLIGIVSDDGDTADTEDDMRAAVIENGAIVPTDAWGPVGVRPAACAVDKCCTGKNGAGKNVVSGGCPLVFNVDGAGNGLGSTVVTAIKVLLGFVRIDIAGTPEDVAGDDVDAVAAFVDKVVAQPNGASPCASGLTVVDRTGDGVAETFDDVLPGTQVCFDVLPKQNTTVPAKTTPQMFKARVRVVGDGVTELDSRDVYFLVPPVIPSGPVE